jgi:hypothetical protein
MLIGSIRTHFARFFRGFLAFAFFVPPAFPCGTHPHLQSFFFAIRLTSFPAVSRF